MAILNYTTQVSVHKTIGEIYSILTKSGALEISTEHYNAQVVAIKFQIIHADRPLWFRMEPKPAGVLKSMERDKVPGKLRTAAQAHRVAWRILKDSLAAQMALYEAQQADVAEVFLPYAIDDKGESFYQAFTASRIKAITSGKR